LMDSSRKLHRRQKVSKFQIFRGSCKSEVQRSIVIFIKFHDKKVFQVARIFARCIVL